MIGNIICEVHTGSVKPLAQSLDPLSGAFKELTNIYYKDKGSDPVLCGRCPTKSMSKCKYSAVVDDITLEFVQACKAHLSITTWSMR